MEKNQICSALCCQAELSACAVRLRGAAVAVDLLPAGPSRLFTRRPGERLVPFLSLLATLVQKALLCSAFFRLKRWSLFQHFMLSSLSILPADPVAAL